MASKKKILKNNSQSFWDDVNRVSKIMTFVDETGSYFTLKKGQVLEIAEKKEIQYYITSETYVVGRNVMVIL